MDVRNRRSAWADLHWVFCWRTVTGEVREGGRDTRFGGRAVPYAPGSSPLKGLRWIVEGHVRKSPRPPTGPRLDHQGTLSRMGLHVRGFVKDGDVLVVENLASLHVLREEVQGAFARGELAEWAAAAVRVGRRRLPAMAADEVSPALAGRIRGRLDRVRLIRLGAKDLSVRMLDDGVEQDFAADVVFDAQALPNWISVPRVPSPTPESGVVLLEYPRPHGRGAWGRWVGRHGSR